MRRYRASRYEYTAQVAWQTWLSSTKQVDHCRVNAPVPFQRGSRQPTSRTAETPSFPTFEDRFEPSFVSQLMSFLMKDHKFEASRMESA